MTLIYGGWCLHQEAQPVRADQGTWECPNPEHERRSSAGES